MVTIFVIRIEKKQVVERGRRQVNIRVGVVVVFK